MAGQGLDMYARPVAYADETSRVGFLKEVATLLAMGVSTMVIVGIASAFVVATVPILQQRFVMMGVVFGSLFLGQRFARTMAYGSNPMGGLFTGATFMGIMMGYLFYIAAMVGAQVYGSGAASLTIVGQAAGLTAATVFSMVAYLWSGPKNLSLIGTGLRVMGVPMLLLMAVSWVFPIGGVFGLAIGGVFVAISGGALLYELNQVMHTMQTNQAPQAAYELTVSIGVLFWNITMMLLRLTSRD